MTEGWADILHPNERVLWQGQPDQKIQWRGPGLPFAFFGVVFAGFALFWMVNAFLAGGFWVFGLFQFITGLSVAFAPLLLGPFIARRTWYSLSSRRAFFASDMPFSGKTLLALDLRPSVGVEFDGQEPGTISFNTRAEPIVGEQFDSAPAFALIPDARTVYGLIRDIQKGSV
ncbi:aspartate carbamoyltransferase catalytic subunit [Celeribacter sp. PS-C1]|uniref:aspartate carbamoyltransferase catalytic subunit n=1 Tax=Celeribacter sp. PS-C1 TaxID=2820813 RepID=UPI001CA5D074|nr:aspartate carbamoyltransferase catalytic subunit [Celeribacter sp. PS-C1]MBW6417871.1 aspartate carbamoyltransferase catalytic subunit [Celeribacter sp. PS-C1]